MAIPTLPKSSADALTEDPSHAALEPLIDALQPENILFNIVTLDPSDHFVTSFSSKQNVVPFSTPQANAHSITPVSGFVINPKKYGCSVSVV